MVCCPNCGHEVKAAPRAKKSGYKCLPRPDGAFDITFEGKTRRLSFVMTEKEYVADKKRRAKMAIKYNTAARNASPLGLAQAREWDARLAAARVRATQIVIFLPDNTARAL